MLPTAPARSHRRPCRTLHRVRSPTCPCRMNRRFETAALPSGDPMGGSVVVAPEGTDPLALDREAMRELALRTVDLLIDWLSDADAPPLRRATPAEMRARLSGPPPEAPQDFDALLAQLKRDVLPFMSRVHHPGFF